VCASVDCLWHLAAPIADKASGLFTNRVRPGSAVWPVSRPGPALSLALAIPPRRYCLIAAATAARRMRPPSLFSSYRTDTAPCRTGTAQRGLTGFAAVSRACTRKVRGDGRAEVRPRERMGANGSARRPARVTQDVSGPQCSGHQQARNLRHSRSLVRQFRHTSDKLAGQVANRRESVIVVKGQVAMPRRPARRR